MEPQINTVGLSLFGDPDTTVVWRSMDFHTRLKAFVKQQGSFGLMWKRNLVRTNPQSNMLAGARPSLSLISIT